MAKRKKSRSKSKTQRRKLSKLLKTYHARVRRIQEVEDVPYAEARRIERKSFIHTIRKTDTSYAGRFFEVERGLWKRIKPGKQAKRTNVFGKKMKHGEVMRSYGVGVYHALVRHLMTVFGKPRAELVRMMQDFREAMVVAARSVGKSIKFRARDIAAVIEYSERYPKLRLQYGI